LTHKKPGKVKVVTEDSNKNRTKNDQTKDQENIEILYTFRDASKVDRNC
jgi:hypothetical protein